LDAGDNEYFSRGILALWRLWVRDRGVCGDTQLNEAWAEFLGKEHHRRVHPAGQCEISSNNWVNYPAALEDDRSFHHAWIPTGVFFDLMDDANSSERNDDIQGFTITQQYNVFSPNIHSFCEYRDRFVQLNRRVSTAQFNDVLRQNGFTDCK
jgi:hypothetical protein